VEAILHSKILAFIIGEVTRQRHDVFKEEGAQRVIWMAEAWNWALFWAAQRPFPRIENIKNFGRYVEREKNANGFRTLNVRVGEFVAPSYTEVPRLLEHLWKLKDLYTPDEFYVEFEKIHPFVDGNGRVGKILHNWLLGKLNDPILVKDYFGHGLP
jgi:hypothetical protein